ncbi:hypothetical protein BDP27DRAFT_1367460 [Rhodocollybia butyracea]|uniref:Uncharacterized protein n=1 Tax=Rhodocollybia butyracea TaxID=206335 RepID=A0A9P5PL71_9AGAR|nr:hypothetical protein BDP27DRAFT_1367460 [Rhodocollybia butyracea]
MSPVQSRTKGTWDHRSGDPLPLLQTKRESVLQANIFPIWTSSWFSKLFIHQGGYRSLAFNIIPIAHSCTKELMMHEAFTARYQSRRPMTRSLSVAQHDPENLRQLRKDFPRHRKSGNILTYVDGALKKWDPPLLVACDGGSMTEDPMVWPMTPGYQAPVCPDIQNPFLDDADCTMIVVCHKVKGKTQYFFEAPHDGCKFKSLFLVLISVTKGNKLSSIEKDISPDIGTFHAIV